MHFIAFKPVPGCVFSMNSWDSFLHLLLVLVPAGLNSCRVFSLCFLCLNTPKALCESFALRAKNLAGNLYFIMLRNSHAHSHLSLEIPITAPPPPPNIIEVRGL